MPGEQRDVSLDPVEGQVLRETVGKGALKAYGWFSLPSVTESRMSVVGA